MRAAPVDLNPSVPEGRPYFWGTWGTTTVTNAWTSLTITNTPATAPLAFKGMKISGGGCQVPISGLYSIGAMMRIDQGGAGQSYFHMGIFVNGSASGYSIKNNGSVGGVYYPYQYAQLWLPQPLNAGDIVTVQAYNWAGTSTVYGGDQWPGAGLRVLYESPWTGEQ